MESGGPDIMGGTGLCPEGVADAALKEGGRPRCLPPFIFIKKEKT